MELRFPFVIGECGKDEILGSLTKVLAATVLLRIIPY
jgi:hypothetical protein